MEVATVLPQELRLGAPPTMPQARSYMFRQQSTLQSYSSGNQIQINIPRLQRSYLRKDSYLRFAVDIIETDSGDGNKGKSLTLDSAGAFGLIQKIEVLDYLGSTVLESISEVPQLMALLLDLGLPNIDPSTNGQSLMGLASGYSTEMFGSFSVSKSDTQPYTVTAQNAFASVESSKKIVPPSSGRQLYAYKSVFDSNKGTRTNYYTAEFAIPLPSFLGFLSKKMVPLHNGFTILLTLSSVENACFAEGKGGYDPFLYVSPTQEITFTNSVNNNATFADGKFKFKLQTMTLSPGQLVKTSGFTDANYNQSAAVLDIDQAAGTFTVDHTGSGTPGATSTVTANGGAYTIFPYIYGYNELIKDYPILPSALTYDMKVTEVFMDCQILELGPVAESMILSSTGGQPLIVHTKSFRSYVGNVTRAAQEFILNLNLNVASLTNVLWMMRSKDQLEHINYQSIGNRTRNLLQRWFFQYGSTSLPQNNGIQTMGSTYPSWVTSLKDKWNVTDERSTEGLQELLKARPVDVQNCRIQEENYGWDYKWNAPLVTDSQYADNADVADLACLLNAYSFRYPQARCILPIGKFAGGLNLELAANKSGDLISGINTNGMNTSIRGVFNPLFTEYTDDVRVDAYAEYDAFINISPGIATTVSF